MFSSRLLTHLNGSIHFLAGHGQYPLQSSPVENNSLKESTLSWWQRGVFFPWQEMKKKKKTKPSKCFYISVIRFCDSPSSVRGKKGERNKEKDRWLSVSTLGQKQPKPGKPSSQGQQMRVWKARLGFNPVTHYLCVCEYLTGLFQAIIYKTRGFS